ncbi:MAG: hypothetical protein LBS19_04225 [Clostridiales bacterium]|nr:hypothetical protein [Clostridiales bacterium]
MFRADCRKCGNRVRRHHEGVQDYSGVCAFDMRFASTAGGSAPDDLHDVYFCRDHQEDGEDTVEEWENI